MLALVCVVDRSPVFAQSQDTLGVVDSLHIGHVTASPGRQVKLPIWVTNDIELISLTVPVVYPSSRLLADSVTFEGGRISHFGVLNPIIDQAQGRIQISCLQFGTRGLLPGSGQIAWIHFTISNDAIPGDSYPVDTGYVNDQSKLLFVGGSDGSLLFLPVVTPGSVRVVEVNLPPVFLATHTYSVREGDALKIVVSAEDPNGDPVHLALLNRPAGATFQDFGTGSGELNWTAPFTGPFSSVHSPFALIFAADDGEDVTLREVPVTVINVNRPPQLVVSDTVMSVAYTTLEWDIVATDPDLDPVTLTVSGVPSPASVAPGNPLKIQWQPVQADTGYYPVTFRATDPNGGATLATSILHIAPGDRVIYSIDTVSGYADQEVTLTISMDNLEMISGVELLFYLDPTAVTITGIDRAGTRIEDWEVFATTQNYNSRPGEIHIRGRADINDGSFTPNLGPGTGPIVSVHLRLTSDDAFVGFSFPARFVFTTDAANTATDGAGEIIPQSEIVYSHGQVGILVNQDRLRGDINLNGLAFEIGDVVYLANYFSNPVAFPLNFEQRANSDVNNDGLTATIADLVYMINVITGQSGPPKVAQRRPVNASWRVSESGALWIDSDQLLGGVYLEYRANTDASPYPGSAARGMTVATGYENQTGRVVVYSLDGALIDPSLGPICEGLAGARVIRVEMSDVSGYAVAAASIGTRPQRLHLRGNYPNPFNPATAISFVIATPGTVQIDIYNVLGVQVARLEGYFQAGEQELIWDGKDSAGGPVPSGVYFYRIEYEGQQEVKRMLLLK